MAGLLPLRANDLDLTSGSRQFPFRDMQEISPLAIAGSELLAPAEPLAQTPPFARNPKWALAIVTSCLLHAAVAAVFLFSPAGTFDFQDATQSEGSDQSGANVVGSALDRETPAIKVTLVPNPQPKQAAAKAQKPVPPTKPPQPTKEVTKQPLEPLPEAVKQSAAIPDILVSRAPDDQSVVPKTPAQPPVQTESTEAPAAFAGQPPIPSARPSPAMPPSGTSEANEKRGTADGQDRSAQAASKGKKLNEAGIAAESSYRSDVIRKLSRVNRGVPPSVQAAAHNNAVVTFVIGSRGGINELRILESSGSEDFDQAILGIVRKAAPFPPIPTKVGNNLVFTGAIGPF
ncbi:TonB family protein [Mesorhizobium sp. M1322]|uniref:TonB family protein n=1 Tax=Mesorhizobium sp. M1322 TaxID=2957081 RepID=UPI00333C4DE3